MLLESLKGRLTSSISVQEKVSSPQCSRYQDFNMLADCSTLDEDMRNFGSNEFRVDVMILRITIAYEHQHFLTPFSADLIIWFDHKGPQILKNYKAHSTQSS